MSLALAVMASGSGTNFQAILDRFSDGSEGVEVRLLVSNRSDAKALDRARSAGVETVVLERRSFPDRAARDRMIGDALDRAGIDLVAMAGYMALLSPELVQRYRGRIINVHPSLLPSFPGLDAIGQALAYGVKQTGVTVHFVDEGLDTGPIIAQRPVPLTYTREPEAVETEIHRVEHQIYPEVIKLIADGRVRIDPDNPRVVIVDEPA